MKKTFMVATAGVLLVAAFIIAAFLYNTQKANDLSNTAYQNAEFLVRDYSPTKGDPGAKVTIIEFFDPACETCRVFYPFVEQLMEANSGQVNLVLRYTPLHDGSDYVVRILEAARLQGKFWETLEAVFTSQPAWASHGQPQPEKLWMYLGRTGLDIEKARKDMRSPEITDRIRQDISDARQLKVSKTPGFFVNGKPLVQFGYEQLQALV